MFDDVENRPSMSCSSLLLCLIWIGITCSCGSAKSIKLDRVALRVSYVQDAEKLQRINVAADSVDVKSETPAVDSVNVSLSDTLIAQVVCSDNDGSVMHPVQAQLRISDESMMPPVDTIWPLTQRRNELRREISLESESRVDRDFWKPNVPYTVQIIVGDPKLAESVIWTVTRKLTLSTAYGKKRRGVFDFDLAVHKSLEPEFDTPIPKARKDAPISIIAAFTALSLIPLLVLLAVWGHSGALSIELPLQSRQRFESILFQLCLVAHAITLTLFWVQWNIVTTWKVMAMLMIPSLYFGRSSIAFIATRQHLEEKKET